MCFTQSEARESKDIRLASGQGLLIVFKHGRWAFMVRQSYLRSWFESRPLTTKATPLCHLILLWLLPGSLTFTRYQYKFQSYFRLVCYHISGKHISTHGFLKDLFLLFWIMCVSISVCLWVGRYAHVYGCPLGSQRHLIFCGTGSKTVSYPVWVLGIELKSSARPVYDLSHWNIYPTSQHLNFKGHI